jgi:hypothetical protein
LLAGGRIHEATMGGEWDSATSRKAPLESEIDFDA